MLNIKYFSLLILALTLMSNPVLASQDKELKAQQKAAHKERSDQKKERSKTIREAQKTYREYSKKLEIEYREKLEEPDQQFALQKVELRAKHEAKVAEANVIYQKKMAALLMSQKGKSKDEKKTLEVIESEAKTHFNELLALEKTSSEEMHQEKISNEQRKNELLTKRDQLILAKAEELGLMADISPILATPIGDSLSSKEEKWNEKEEKEVIKLKERNLKLIKGKFKNGEQLRNWQIQNLNEDFKLALDKKAELHAITFKNSLSNLLLKPSDNGQNLLNEMAERNKQMQLIKTKYKKIKDQNRIKRRAEKKKILNQ